ncbi:hypothetical protein D9M71_833650 [compost metagenome]
MPLMFIPDHFWHRCVMRHDNCFAVERFIQLLGEPVMRCMISVEQVTGTQLTETVISKDHTEVIHPLRCGLGSCHDISGGGEISPSGGAEEPCLIPNKNLVFQDVDMR